MNPSEPDIESRLHRAPKPAPPPGLKQELFQQMTPASTPRVPPTPFASQPVHSWWRRWWPALAPAAVSLAGVVVLAVQQTQIHRRERTMQISARPTPTESGPLLQPIADESSTLHPIDPAIAEQKEIARLAERAQQLTADIAELEQTQKENESLRSQLAAPPTLSQADLEELSKAKDRALSIQCINNLKQFGLAVRMWALDNNVVFPTTILSMSNELNTPKILVCPADTNRPVAVNWAAFTSANLSYEYLAAGATNGEAEPDRVLVRCPIHGHIGLCDGSVQSSVARRHPERLISSGGKLYLKPPPAAN